MRLKSALLAVGAVLVLTPGLAQAAPAVPAGEPCDAGYICTYKYLFHEGKNLSRTTASITGCVDIPESQSYRNMGGNSIRLWKYSNCTGDYEWAVPGTGNSSSHFSYDAVSRY